MPEDAFSSPNLQRPGALSRHIFGNYSAGRRFSNAEQAGERGGRGVELEEFNLEFLRLHLAFCSPRPPRSPLLRVEIDFVAGIQGFDLSSYHFCSVLGLQPR